MEVSVYSVIICIIFSATELLINTNACPTNCSCNEEKNQTMCMHLNYIPNIPKYSHTLYLKHCFLEKIERKSFMNVSSIEVKRLVLWNSSVHYLSSDAFLDLNYLQELEFRYEHNLNITSVKNSFLSLNISLIKNLHFVNNGWERMPLDLFIYLTLANITTLSVEWNNMEVLETAAFQPLNSIKKLSLKNNEIAFVNMTALKNVKELDFSCNNIFKIPSFCSVKESLTPKLLKLKMNDNAIRWLPKGSFRCLEGLKTLELKMLRIQELQDYTFVLLKSLKRLFLGNNPQLKKISRNALSSSSIQELYFTMNGFRFDDERSIYEIFNSTPNLKKLDLTKNYLPRSQDKLLRMLSPLTKLETLDLSVTSIPLIPIGLLQSMPFLTKLVLTANRIQGWDQRVFENVTSLRNLSLNGNFINFINKTSFPGKLLNSLKSIDMSGNDYFCTCELKWFLDMIRSNNLTKIFKQWPGYYRCFYPEKLKNSLLIDFHPSIEECTNENDFLKITLSATFVGFLVFVIPFVLIICQTNIRNTIYLFRIKRKMKSGYLRLESSEDFEFDCFIIYCDADRLWVHGKLLKRLENDGLRVCVHHRDFVIGESISTNIETYMSRSFKTVIIMSNKFAESEWCQWEIELVQERRRRQGKEAIVLIMHRQIDSLHMTSTLRALLSTTPYLQYKEGFGENMFWDAVINDVKRPLAAPPTAVL